MLTTALALLSVLGSSVIDTPKAAEELMATAQARAAQRKAAVMVIFHASWCGWCKRLDAFMERPSQKPVFAKYYEIVHLDVLESGDKKALENPGGEAMMEKWGGKGAGLPFIAVVDAKGKLIVNSLKNGKPGANVGCPWEPDEVAWFMTMVGKSSSMTPEEKKALERAMLAQKHEKGG